MHPTGQPGFEFILEQLRWSLGKPLAYGDREWAERVARGLDRLGDAFDRHVGLVQGPDGPLDHMAGAEQLPFTEEARQVQRLRHEHEALRGRVALVAGQFRGALQLFPAPDGKEPPLTPDIPAEARAFRMFEALGACVADLLAALEAHLAAEDALAGVGAGPMHRLQAR
jgi:hypothetical protein